MALSVLMKSCSRFTLVFVLLGLSACKPIIQFTGDSLLDEQGNESGLLQWDISGKESDQFQLTGVVIEPGIGAVDVSGELAVYPVQTTTYTLTAYSNGPNNTIYNASRSVTIHIGPRIDYQLIADDNLRACLQATGFTHIEQFDAIYCVDKNIRRLDGIEQFVDALSVSLDFNRLTDLSPLTQLPRLGVVSLTYNHLTSLDSLVASTTIRNILAFNNQLSDVSALAAMPQLVSLALDNNQLFDTVGLEGLDGLQALSLTYNQIADVAALGALRELRALDFSHNPVTAGVPALNTLKKAVAIRSEGNGGVRCLDYANLLLSLGPVVVFDKCRFF